MALEIGLLVFPKVQQLDLTGPYEVFAALPDARVYLVAKTIAPVTSATGLVLTPTTTFSECPALDVLCVPGGVGVNALMEDAETLAFVRRQASTARYITSVCTGALVLGAAGLLEGRRATTHWAAHDLLAAFGAIPVEGRVVRDGNLVTGGGVTAGIDFALTLAAELTDPETAQAIQLQHEYAPAPPFDAGGRSVPARRSPPPPRPGSRRAGPSARRSWQGSFRSGRRRSDLAEARASPSPRTAGREGMQRPPKRPDGWP